jgi:hypothetical protein
VIVRLEYKYLVPSELLPKLRAMVGPFVEADAHNRDSEGYTVRSIYFDTATFGCYHDKVAGLDVRKKIRIRGYDECSEGSIVFVETKRKYGERVVKKRAPVAYDHVGDLFVSGDVERYVLRHEEFPDAFEDARRFFFHVHRRSLRPVILAIYEREAYYSKLGVLRITFDKNLRSSIYPSIDALFNEDSVLYSIPGHFILELKLHGGLPPWLKSIVGALDLKRQALSKYGICVDRHRMLNRSTKRTTPARSHTFHF